LRTSRSCATCPAPRRPTNRALAAVTCALLWLAAGSVEAQRYDPRLHFSSLRTAHFTIHFHPGQETLAGRLADLAEEVHARLAVEFPGSTRRHTHVILADQDDGANGWATPLPYNIIEMTVAAPPPSSTIGYTDDWLRLVFTHEYVHILHLDRSRGIFGGLRRVFGRAPLLFPNVFLPGWSTEGLATYIETTDTGTGRVNAGDFRLIVDAAARAGAFEPIDRASGALVDWPGGHTPYAYGSRFHEYLAARFGTEALGQLADATAGRLPYMPGGAYKRVFGVSAATLWQDFARSLEEQARETPAASPSVQRLTSHGFAVSGPRWTHEGSAVVYSRRDPHDFPALMEARPGVPPRRLASRVLGERASVTGTHVVFDQREFVASVALQSDLYALDLRTGEVQRLTRDARASDPDVAPGGDVLAAVVEGNGMARLVTYPVSRGADGLRLGRPTTIAETPETQFAAPRWSPDGTRLAAERRRLGQRPDVVVIEAATRQILLRVEGEDGRVGEPEWTRDGSRLVVSWERPRRPFNLFEVELETGRAHALLELPNGARAAAVAPDGSRIAFIGYTPDGFDVFVAPVPQGGAAERGLQVRKVDETPRADRSSAAVSSQPYSPADTILPRFWMPIVTTGDDRLEVGAATAGMDVLGRHAYGAAAWWSDRARPDWYAAYVYQRWRPTVFLSASQDVSPWEGADFRESAVDLGTTIAFRTVRRTQLWFGALHATREEAPGFAFDRRSTRVGYQVSTARRYGYSVSLEEGLRAGATAEFTRRGLGADADATTLTVDLRAYPRVGGRNRVLAFRAAGGASWGDRSARRVFGGGGAGAPASAISFSRSALGLARGFDRDDIIGDRALVFNMDYRVPLARVERGIRTWPVFLRQLHAAVFVDAAHAWREQLRIEDFRTSAGAEISADVVLGHYLPLTLTGGVAIRHDPAGRREGGAIFGRVGYGF
jgi:Tol biopolymer transport system component